MVYADAENAYGNLGLRNAGFETVPVPFNKYKDEGIENLARYFEQEKIKITNEGDMPTVVRQLLRYHKSEAGRIVKKDDHGPDALLCAALPFPFIDEFNMIRSYAPAEFAAGGVYCQPTRTGVVASVRYRWRRVLAPLYTS